MVHRSALLIAALIAVPAMAPACTTFLLHGQHGPLVGKSYDWGTADGVVLYNKRGISKRALVLGPGTPAEWTSRYASLTFNQYGAEMPNGGMNTAGLVVEVMWLSESEVPAADDRPAVNELQWIQYQLDTFGSVGEMVQAAPGLRVARIYGAVHYLACDVSGDCAAFEYLEGRLHIHHRERLPVPTLANHTYAASTRYLADFKGFGGTRPVRRSMGSLDRFVRASSLARPTGQGDHQRVFGVLDSVKGSRSQWHIAYDLKRQRVYFRTRRSPAIKHVDLARFEPSCATPRQALDIDAPAPGDAGPRFADYTDALNARLLARVSAPLAHRLPPGAVQLLSLYPRSGRCTQR